MQRRMIHASNMTFRRSTTRRSANRGAGLFRVSGWPIDLAAIALALGLAGCGTNLDEILFQSGTALGRTYLDLLLTDVANTLADRCDQDDEPIDGDQNGDAADDGNGDDGGVTDGGFEDLVGDPAAGEPLYASCAACHCADAVGGCLPGTPGVVGVSAETLDEFLRGDAPHPPSDLTDQEIVDLEAYLASLGG